VWRPRNGAGAAIIAAQLATVLAVVVTAPAAALPSPTACKAHPVIVLRGGGATAEIYAEPRGGAGLCAFSGRGRNKVSETGSSSSESGAGVPAKAIQVFWAGMSGDPGLVVLYGRVGASVTAVTIDRSNHFAPARALVAHGWYAVMWSGAPHRTHPTNVRITTGATTRTYPLPPAAQQGVPGCGRPPNSGCASQGPGQTVGP
jgi:hypothetical protein